MAETIPETLQQVVDRDPPSPRLLNTTVPRDLETICLKCLEKEPSRRYETSQSVAEELSRFIRQEPILARPLGPAGRLRRWCRRKPALATSFAFILLLLLTLSIGSPIATYRINHQRQRADREAERAKRAEQQTKAKLWDSYLAQAQARRWSGRIGRRFESLDALKRAAEIRPSLELRNEAIACMALSDLRMARQWEIETAGKIYWAFDSGAERYAKVDVSQNLITIHRTTDDLELMRASGCKLPVLAVEFSPNGQYLVLAGGSNLPDVRFWDLRRNQMIVPRSEFYFRCMGFSPDSRLLAVAHRRGGPIVLYELATGNILRTFQQRALPWSIAFDPSGRWLAISSEQTKEVEIKDVETGTLIKSLSHSNSVKRVSWHPSGRFLATACQDHNLYIWDTVAGNIHLVLQGHEAPITNVRFDPTGNLLTSDGWDAIGRIWDFWTGRQILGISGTVLGFSLDERRMVSGPVPAIWELARGRECWTVHTEARAGLAGLGFSPVHELLASGHSDGVRLWDLEHFREMALLKGAACKDLAFHPNGRSLFAVAENGLTEWALDWDESGQSKMVLLGTLLTSDTPIEMGTLTVSPDGRTIATAGTHLLHLWDYQKRRERRQLARPQRCWSLAFSPDSQWLAAGFFGHEDVMVWQVESGELIQKLPVNDSAQLAFSPDNQWLVTATSTEYRFWKAGSWEPAQSIARRGAQDHAGALSFSPGGKVLAIAEGRSLVRLVDAQICEELATLEAPFQSEVTRLRFNSDGSRLAAACLDKTIQVWDLRLIRQQLAAMKLDWDLPPLPTPRTDLPSSVVVMGDTNQQNAALAEYCRNQAYDYASLGRYEEAITEYKRAIELKPNSARAYNELAWVYITGSTNIRSAEKALPLALKAVDLAKTRYELNTLGLVYYRLGQMSNAIVTFDASIKASQSGGKAYDYFFLAMAHHRSGDKFKAQDCFTKATNWLANQNLALEDYVELEAFRKEAEELLGQSAKKDSGSP